MVQLGLKSGQVHLRACSVNLSAESAWDGWSHWNDLSLKRAGPTSIKTCTPVLSRPSSPSHTKRPRAAHEWLIVRGLSFPPHKSYLINCEHFPPKRHSLIVRLTSIPPCFCLSVQNVTNHRRDQPQSIQLATELAVFFQCLSKMYSFTWTSQVAQW